MTEYSDAKFLALCILSTGYVFPGRNLRRIMALKGGGGMSVKMSGPSFYYMMNELNVNELVDAWDEEKYVQGNIIRERCFRIRDEGRQLKDTWADLDEEAVEALRFLARPRWLTFIECVFIALVLAALALGVCLKLMGIFK